MKKNAAKLTKSVCEKAQYAGKGDKGFYAVWDSELRGFGLRVSVGGSKTFILSYRFGGRKRMLTIAAYGHKTVDEARKEAKKKIADVLNGIDPADTKQNDRRGATVKIVFHDYIENHAKQFKRTWGEDERRINKHVIPKYGTRLIQNLSRFDVQKIHDTIGKKARYEANRVITLISTVIEYARKRGFVESTFENPARGVDMFEESKRDRWVKPDELPKLAAAIADEESFYVRAAIWTYLFTGARKSEILNLKWKDIDLDRRTIRLEKTKANRIHHIPLSAPAVELISTIPKQVGNEYVFIGAIQGKPLHNIDKPWRRIRAAAGLDDVRLHDLRRTVGSWLASSGYSLPLIGKILNHSNASTTQIYAHIADDPQRRALEDIGGQLVRFMDLKKNETKRAAGE